MAEKPVHKIAKERGLSSRDVLEALRDGGLTVSAAADPVDEAEVDRILGPNPNAPKPEPEPAPVAVEEPVAEAAPEPAPVVEAQAPAKKKKAVGPKIIESTAAAPAPVEPPVVAEPASEPEPEPTPEPVAAAPEVESTPEPAPSEPAAVEAEAPEAEAPKAEEAPPEEPEEKGKLKIGEKPKPGAGPKIISEAPPPQRPKRDESKSRPTGRGGGFATRDGGSGAGGKRRVVIDSQAARRGPGGPGGPGGGPGGPGGPGGGPQHRPRRRGRRRREVLEEVAPDLDIDAMTHRDKVRINSGSSVRDVAEYLGVPVPEVIKKLMLLGEMATLTQTLSDDHIQVIADEFKRDIEIVHVGDEVEEELVYDDADSDLVERPPVVTIMGHVDHGKTSLLDAIRQSEVVAGEAGGITQHIGAYQVHHDHEGTSKLITFLDTPGHEAFTAMRARGARVTDIAVIVVAADDGVKPQTEEAIDHARAADVPIVVAVNKIDKEGADPTRVRTEMTQHNLQPAEWGGETEYVDVSAKTQEGLEDLLETLLVVSELEELKANADTEASGVVVESKLDPGRGPVATVLVQRGTMRVGDALVAGAFWGKVRAMTNHLGERVAEARPGDPVEVLGIDGVPDAGEVVRGVENDREARRQAQERETRLKAETIARRSGRKMSFEDVFRLAKDGDLQELPIVVKGDVAGSVEAIEDEIAKLPQDEIVVNVIHSGVGGINESDVMLAAASDAVILGFNVRPVGAAREVSDREGVEIRNYSVIYKALDDLRAAMEGLLEPEEVEETIGAVEIRQTFKASRLGTIAGSYVTDGIVRRGSKARIVRDGTVIYDTTIESLRRFNEDAREVAAGFECGIVLANFQDVKEGDVLEVYETKQVERELQPS
ncbi:MAG TPA: translation initiation factor IF-2 [Baekduia sp.]|nr:translation initiation factor IF-2 [Baekduia sp.]